MKKLLVFIFLFCVLNADDKSDALSLIEKQTGRKMSVVEFTPLKYSKFSLLIIKDNLSGFETPLIVESGAKSVIVPSAFLSSNKEDSNLIQTALVNAEKKNFKVQNSAKLNKLFKQDIPQSYGIKLDGNPKGKLKYIVTDPMCSHCQAQLSNIKELLKESSIILIPVGFLTPESTNKAAQIIQETKKLTTNEQKINLLQEVYSRSYVAKYFNNENVNAVKQVSDTITRTGIINSVPFIYEID